MTIYQMHTRDDGLIYYPDDHGNYHIRCDVCGEFYRSGYGMRFPSHGQAISFCDGCFANNTQWFYRCEHCHSSYLRDNQTHVLENGDMVCDSCHSSYSTCDSCGEFRYVHFSGNGYTFCSTSCMNDANFTVCHRCGDLTSLDDFDEEHDSCNSCVSYHMNTCRGCGDEFYDDDGYDSEYCCEDCYESQNLIRSYSYKPSPIFYESPSEVEVKRFYGLELEIDRGDRTEFLSNIDANDERFYLKEDSSLGDYGVEIVTHPMSLKYHQDNFCWNEISKIAKDSGYRSHDTDTCGLHIHVSKASVSLKRWCKFTLFWYSHDPLIERICRRSNGHYYMKKQVCDTDSVGVITNSNTRYEAINYQNRNTVEIRQFKGTLNVTSILASIEFIDFLLGWLYRIPLKKISSLTTSEFFSALEKKSKVYPHLISYCEKRLED